MIFVKWSKFRTWQTKGKKNFAVIDFEISRNGYLYSIRNENANEETPNT